MDITTTVKIEINNTKIDLPFSSLIIRESMDDHHSFEVHFGLENNEVKVLELLEKSISETIKISFELDTKTHLFKGVVTQCMVDKGSSSYGHLVVSGYSPTILLDDIKDCNYFNNVNLTDIAKKITDAVPLGIKTNFKPAYQGKLKHFMQYRETGFDLLKRLAKLYGEWFYYNGTELTFGTYSPGTVIDLELGFDIFDINLMAQLQPMKFKEKYYNYVTGTEFMAQSGTDPGLDSFGKKIKDKSNSVFSHQSVSLNSNLISEQNDLKAMVDSSYSAMAGKMVVLTARSRRSDLQVGSKINVKDYGSFIITSIIHSCESLSKYTNKFKAVPSSLIKPPRFRNDIPEYPALEIQDAKITANDDPDGLGRVRVRFYWMESGDQTWWIRVMAASSGNGKGHFFIPEVDDDVLVAFQDNNPNKPYVMGSVYHGKTKPSQWKNAKNHVKGIKTVSGNELLISDENGKETITIQQKGAKNEIVITLEGDGKISLTTKGDMIFKADKSISFEAKEEIKMKSHRGTSITASDVKIDANNEIKMLAMKDASLGAGNELELNGGNNLKAQAGANLDLMGGSKAKLLGGVSVEVTGGGTAELKAAGKTTIQGLMVAIN